MQEASMQRHSPLKCVLGNKTVRGEGRGGLGVLWYSLIETWILLWEKACVWFEGILFRTERGTKGRHTPPQSPNDDLQQQGQTTKARDPAALSNCNMLHVTVQPVF